MIIDPISLMISSVVSSIGIFPLISLLVLALLIVLAIVFIVLKNKSSVGVELGPIKFKIGNSKKNFQVFNLELLESILASQEDNIKRMLNFENEISKRQINYTEQKLSQLRYILSTAYSELLSNKIDKDGDVKTHRDYKSYNVLISVLIKELTDNIFQPAFIENHLNDMENEIWEKYLVDKSNYIINHISEFMDDIYGEGKLITRKETYIIEKDSYSEIKKIIKEIFESIKKMSLQFKEEYAKIRIENKNHILVLYKNNGVQELDGNSTRVK